MDPVLLEDCFGRYSSDSTCPSRGVFSFAPLVILWITLPFQCYQLSTRQRKKRIRTGWLHNARLLGFLVLFVSEAFVLFWSTIQQISVIRLALAGFNVASYTLSLNLYLQFHQRGFVYNLSLCLTFGLLSTTQIIDFIVLLFERPLYEQNFPIQALAVMAETALLTASDRSNKHKDDLKTSPEEHAGFLSKLFMQWVTPLVSTGSRKALETDDLYPLHSETKCERLMPKWEENWHRRQYECAQIGKEPSIAWALFSMYRTKWLCMMSLRAIADFLNFMNPILLKYLLDFIADPSAPFSLGIGIALCMFMMAEIRSLLMNKFIYSVTVYAVKLQNMLINCVFRKTLRLSPMARSSRTVGEIVNFMAIDVEKLIQVLPFIHNIWSTLLQITIAMVFLCFVLGPPAIGGICIMLMFFPINYYSSRYQKRCQIAQMKVKDTRVKMCNEVLSGIKLIKLYAWEEAFEEKINKMREDEVYQLRKAALVGRAVDAANAAAPFLVAVVSFGTYVLWSEENILTPQKAFVSLAIFNQIRQPMRIMAQFINNLVQASVSEKRLKRFLNADEICKQKWESADPEYSIQMKDVTMNWRGPTYPIDLSSISFDVQMATLTTIVGTVGSGKSSLLAAILGEMNLLDGTVRLTGRIGYVPQQPWLQNVSMRENIIYGRKFDKFLYKKIVDACELQPDFSIFPQGDLTEVGENGVTLSGGQKARLGLARALYQEADVYLLDDVLSAVDAHVGAHVFEKVISNRGLLAGKTRILVTHGLQYTQEADNIVVMKDGRIIEQGAFNELRVQNGQFNELLQEYNKAQKELEDEEKTESETDPEDGNPAMLSAKRRTRLSSSMSEKSSKRIAFVEPKMNKPEKVATGRVHISVYGSFMKAATLKFSISFFAFLLLHYCFLASRSVWLSQWSDSAASAPKNASQTVFNRLSVYTLLGVLEVIAIILALTFLVLSMQAASLRLHRPLLNSILRSPMQFFDTTPIGRILTRLSRDLEVVDSQLPQNLRQFVQCSMQVLMILCMISYSTPLFVLTIIPLFFIYFLILRYFIPNRSPIEAIRNIVGATSIRAYGKVEDTCNSFGYFVDNFIQCRHLTLATNRWLGIRLELLGNTTVLMAALMAVLSTRFTEITPGLVGLSVSFALSITEQLNLAVRMLSDLETNIVSVERIKEYTGMDEEMEWYSDCPPDVEWPSKGRITWGDYSTKYRENLPLVVKNLSATIAPGEKVAVVGRTGSGKSSLTLGLFRLVEPTDGRITIDNIDIYNIGLHDLRAKLTIIPQEPVLFSGPLRFNLDPFGKYSDADLWSALESCQLKEFVERQTETLDYLIAEGGKNMSVGQRQLVCLGRAILRKGKIVILDEATAAVDVATDALVQKVIREKFADSTVIAIAHRLNTVAGYDRIMVLEKGELAEFDTPQRLLADKSSRYSRMIEKSKHH
ncbi:unnamed protein product, partial [Mesorhabditis belari]|uniref:Uncharacterized protein n=1 Tax=Mesorhabditis belari TaxID=2138241 RepID=A0AAF3EDM9_9BILA